jgi:hypothetical protein
MKLILARVLAVALALVVTALPSLAQAEGSHKAHAAHAIKRAKAGPKAGAKPHKAAPKAKAPRPAKKAVKAPRAAKKAAK